METVVGSVFASLPECENYELSVVIVLELEMPGQYLETNPQWLENYQVKREHQCCSLH